MLLPKTGVLDKPLKASNLIIKKPNEENLFQGTSLFPFPISIFFYPNIIGLLTGGVLLHFYYFGFLEDL